MKSIFSLLLYSVQAVLPFMAIVIAYSCFKSLFGSLKPIRPLIVLLNRATGEKIPIVYWENSLGRDKHCDIVINSPTASRDHAVLYRRSGGWFISDTNSKTGVLLNGQRIKNDEKILIGDTISVGGITYEICRADVLGIEANNSGDIPRTAYSGGALLVLITIFQILSVLNICVGLDNINYDTAFLIIFMIAFEWMV